MNLIAIIVALACQRLFSQLRVWREHDWSGRYLGALRRVPLVGKAWKSAWGLLFLVPPVLLVGLIQSQLQEGILGIVGFLFAILVLIAALGPRDLWEQVHEYLAARKDGHHEKARGIARELATIGGADSDEPDDRALLQAVLLQAHERVFGVLFWFVVLGPLGAAAYRLIAELPRQLATGSAGSGLVDAAARLHAIAAWLPLRLSAAVYGLAGSTDGALAGWRRAESGEHGWVVRGWYLLAESGCGALRFEEGADHHQVVLELDESLRQALGLAWRSLMIVLAVLAVLTIGGWLA